jgi:hypothetical protein
MKLADGAKMYKGTLTDAFGYALKQYDCNVLFVSQNYRQDDIVEGTFAALYNLDHTVESFQEVLNAHLVSTSTIQLMRGVELSKMLAQINAYIRTCNHKRVVVFTDTLSIANLFEAQSIPSSYLRR